MTFCVQIGTNMKTIDHIELRALRLFDSVASSGSFSEAGRDFDLPRAVVSRIVAQLESSLGVRLFQRTTRKVALTEEGEALILLLRPALSALRESLLATQAKTADAGGVVTVSVAHGLGRHCVLPALARFRQLNPDIHVELRLAEGMDDLVDGRVDLVIRQGVLPDSSIVARRLGALKLVFAVPVEFRSPKILPDIKSLPGIGFRVPGSGQLYQWSFEKNGERRLMQPDALVLTTDSIEAVADQVLAGVGAAPVPEYLVKSAVKARRVRIALAGYSIGEIPVHLCFGSRELMPKRVRLLADFLAADMMKMIK
jgi:DNA-binding transcriptional LysR family regulator